MSEQSERFRDRVNTLVAQVQQWAEPHEWVARPYPKKLRDTDSGDIFEVPSLFLQRGPIRVLLDPIAYDVPGSEGLVDLYLMPTYDDVASFYFENGSWRIHYGQPADLTPSSGVLETKPLSLDEQTVNEVLDTIAAHAEPSL